MGQGLRAWLGRTPAGSEERIDPASPWWGEHMARYGRARSFTAGKRVLDVACGTGYGLRALAEDAAWVVGVDVDEDALRRARAELPAGKGEVVRADALQLPFADGHFDVVTSFETIEHLEQRGRFLAELRRVLSPAGALLLSTPNARYTLPVEGRPRNPFHLHEYTPEELSDELGVHFAEVEVWGQVLTSRFVVPPFDWDQRQVTDPVLRAASAFRRVLHRLPGPARDRTSRVLWGHDFFPRAEDYWFSQRAVPVAPVLFATCRGRRLAA